MSLVADTPVNVLPDSYRVWVPIEDTDLLKSVEVDANGDWIVQGVMTSDVKDEEEDSITPEGMDCSYFLTKGWIKYEHGNSPNQFIGEPLEVRVGQFTHPTLQKSVNGIYVKGRLFQNRELAKQAVTAIEDLKKSHTKRTMGWSIEGGVKERDRKTGKILKSVLRNVVLTMNPVNTMTWAELAKSFSKDHEVEINMVDKSLDTAGMAEVMPQSVEGGAKSTEDEQERWIKLFRSFVHDHMKDKDLRKSFVVGTAAEAGMGAYLYGRHGGLDYDEACQYAAYISERYPVLKSLFGKIGGDNMPTAAQAKAAVQLDTDLEELRKSLETADEEEEELIKAHGADDQDDDNQDEEDGDDDNQDEEKGEDEEEDEEKGDLKKALTTDFAKSLGKTQQQAFDVSGFLQDIAEEFGFNVDGLQKSLSHVAKQQGAVVNALTSLGGLVQTMASRMDELSSDNEELRKSLDTVLSTPVGRKGVVNQREVQTITKSMDKGNGAPLTRSRVMEVLNKSFEAGNMGIGTEIMRYEGGTPFEQLRLTSDIKQELGLE